MQLKIPIKPLFLLTFIFFTFTASATNYYLSNSGNDANSGTDPSSPWQTLNKLNSFKNLKPGDNVLFKRGDTFYGSITVNKSGTAGSPIIIGTYGIGANPVISGFTTLNSWSAVNDTVQKCTIALKTHPEMVTIDGKPIGRGRYPNTGYLSYESFVKDSSITDNQLTGTPNWTGAEVVIRANAWSLTRNLITNHIGTKIKFAVAQPGVVMTANFGYFIQNSYKTLDTTGEWYYDGTDFQMYFGNKGDVPANHVIKVSSIDTLVYINQHDYITFDNITFEGADFSAFELYNTNHITVQNCAFNYSGRTAIFNKATHYTIINNCNFNNTYNNAIDNIWSPDHELIENCTIKNTGLIAGTGVYGIGANYEDPGDAISMQGSCNRVEYNTIDSTGHSGIRFSHGRDSVRNNFINHFALTRNDAGGIYTVLSDSTGSLIQNNIVINGVGNNGGMNGAAYLNVQGLYFDNFSKSITATGNSIANIHDVAICVQVAHELNINGNTTFNSGYFEAYLREIISFSSDLVRNINLKNNIFVAKKSTDGVMQFWTNGSSLPDFGTVDSNYYARPIDDNLTMTTGIGSTFTNRTLAQWKTYTRQDANSNKSPKTITDTADLRFEYNATASPEAVSLPYNYIDAKGATYNGTITLAPYSSAVLIRNGAITNQPPIANAGTDQTITLPTNYINLSGSGTDPDGNISAYTWTEISGPSAIAITNATSAAALVTGLVQGVYEFELKVTDNDRATDLDTVRITVNAAVNIPPKANAGSDQSITLPVNIASLAGSGTDQDGTVVNYNWTKLSGPSSYNIVNASSPVTDVSGLVQGVYQFELKATDNIGAVGKDTVHITVNAVPNIPPTADAGSNQSITLPINNITINGSGIDSDGTISSYLWTKIAGPSGGMINNANSATATMNNLSEGVYKFELTVTDDKGTVGKDTVQITVNPAPNISPTANAGGDKTITLPTNTVSLSGNGTDADGTISSYSWTKISGPSAFSIKNASSPTSEVAGLVEGVYLFELTVTDNNGASGNDTVKVTVNPAKNIPPVAQAGSNQTITLPTNTISLNGNGVDSDGTISTYLWTKIAGPAAGTITDASSALTTVKGLIEGNYIFQLTVTDNGGAKGTDTLYVTVYAPKNIAPTANAGGDLTIVIPVNSVYLNGSGNDIDGTITAYQWKQIAGPDSASITTDNQPSTEVKNLVGGTYEFELTVTDNNEETGRDTVSVVVALGRFSEQESNSIKIYPNPVKEIATVEINTAEPTSNLSILISDFGGRIVYKKMVSSIEYHTVEKINMSNFSKGSYTISVFFRSTDKQISHIIKL